MALFRRGLIDIHSLSPEGILSILELARRLKEALARRDIPGYKLGRDRDMLVALLFYENSTRTRSSFEIAALRLGLQVTGFGSIEGSSVKKGESLAHTLDMFDAYQCDAVILRHPLDGAAKLASNRVGIPVFNAGDGKRQHPTQTILDLFTILERHGRLDHLHIGLSGDLKYGRTAHTLALALTLFPGNTLHLNAPANLAMPAAITDLARARGTEVVLHTSLERMVPELDIFYQTRIQRERMPDPMEFEEAKKAGVFTLDLMDRTRPGFGLMHPLPIDKALPGILPELDDHPGALYKTQAGNGVPTRMAQLALALGLADDHIAGAQREIDSSDSFLTTLPVSRKPVREGVSIRPIRDRGVVIDHLRPYAESLLARLLKLEERGDIYRAATVRSVKRPENIKGMLMIEDRALTEAELALVAALSPGARVNRIVNSQVIEKLALALPDTIAGIESLHCPNSGCVSRPEHREHVAPSFVKMGPDTVACTWCDHVMNTRELFSSLSRI